MAKLYVGEQVKPKEKRIKEIYDNDGERCRFASFDI